MTRLHHTLRITHPTIGVEYRERVFLGSALGARRVSPTAYKLAQLPGALVEVDARGSWEPRRIIAAGKGYYLRTVAR